MKNGLVIRFTFFVLRPRQDFRDTPYRIPVFAAGPWQFTGDMIYANMWLIAKK